MAEVGIEYQSEISFDDGTNIVTIRYTESQQSKDIKGTDTGEVVTGESQDNYIPPSYVIAFKLSLTCVLALASLISNVVVFVIFSSRPVLLSISNKLVLHLAVCNFVLTLVLLPLVLNGALHNEWRFGQLFCNVSSCAVTSLICVSSMTLLCISIDRYHAIAKPLRYSCSLTSKRTYKSIILMWSLSFTFSLFPLTLNINYDHQLNICFADLYKGDLLTRIYVYLFSTVFFIIPLACMLVVYLKIFDAAKRTTANARTNSLVPGQTKSLPIRHPYENTVSTRYSMLANKVYHTLKFARVMKNPVLHKDDFKAAITGFLCVSTFTLSWIPFFFVLTLKVSQPGLVQDWMGTSAVHVALTSCIFNPCLYVFRSQIVRREVDSYLRRRSSVDVTGLSSRRINSAVLQPVMVRHLSEPCTHSSEYKDCINQEHFNGGRTLRSQSLMEKTNSVSDEEF